MIVPNQKVKVKWHPSNKQWFIDKGYHFTKFKDIFEVFIEELQEGSKYNIKLICDMCSIIFEQKYAVAINRGNHFCSHDCYNNFRKTYGSHNNTQVKINCSYCGKEFMVKKYRYEKLCNGEQSFLCCSRDCQNKFIGLNNRGENNSRYKIPIKKNCIICGKEFEVAQNRKDSAKYCSVKCQRIGVGKQNIPTKKRILNCDNCNKEFERWEYEIDKYEYHFCSAKCRKEFQGVFIAKQQNKIESTACQILVNNTLDDLNIKYENEKSYDYYAVDNYLIENNLIIEVMGDYWHSNPTIYFDYNSLNDMQTNRIKVDKSKKSYICNNYGIKILYLWENDIKNSIEICKKLILKYCNTNGILEDYNSYNYYLYDNTLKLKNELIKPYFLRANTTRQVI